MDESRLRSAETPRGRKNADYPQLTRGLLKRGYLPKDVEKIMGGNFLRVWKRVTG